MSKSKLAFCALVAMGIASVAAAQDPALSLSVCQQKRAEIMERSRTGHAGRVTGYFTPELPSYNASVNKMEGALRVGNTLYIYPKERFNINNAPSGCVFGYGSFGKRSISTANGTLSPCLDPLFTVATVCAVATSCLLRPSHGK
jgi:hypothetical protein